MQKTTRGGYDDVIPGKFRPRHLVYENRYIDVVEPITNRWTVSVGPIGPSCQHLVRVSDKNVYCGVEDKSNKILLSMDEECHALVIGSSNGPMMVDPCLTLHRSVFYTR